MLRVTCTREMASTPPLPAFLRVAPSWVNQPWPSPAHRHTPTAWRGPCASLQLLCPPAVDPDHGAMNPAPTPVESWLSLCPPLSLLVLASLALCLLVAKTSGSTRVTASCAMATRYLDTCAIRACCVPTPLPGLALLPLCWSLLLVVPPS